MKENFLIDQEVKSIQNSILKMFNNFSNIFQDLTSFFLDNDEVHLKSVKKNYLNISLYRHRVTEKIIWKITKQGMMSIDLRFNIAQVVIMEIITDSARIANSLAKFLEKKEFVKDFLGSIKSLLKIVSEMIDVCQKLLITGNLKLLVEMDSIEDTMNHVYEDKSQKLISYLKKELNISLTKNALKTYSQFRHLEKVCDNLIRIGKWIFYSKKLIFMI